RRHGRRSRCRLRPGHDPASSGRDRHGQDRPAIRGRSADQGVGGPDHRGAGRRDRRNAGLAGAERWRGTGAVDTVSRPLGPHNVDLTPDGKLLLAVGDPATEGDHESDGHGNGEEAAAEGLLVILDPQNIAAPKATVAVGSHPAHVVADRQGRAFVSLAGGDEIAVVDLAKAEVIGRIATGDYPHGLRLSPDGTQLYVANVEDGSESVIDTQALSEVARIPVGTAPVQVGFTPSGDQVYVSLRDENRVAVIDTSTRQVTNRIEVGPNPIQMFATADGAYVYVANQGTDAEPNNTVSVIDTATGQVVK